MPEYTEVDADEFELLDLRRWDSALQATHGVDQVYALARDVGGMGRGGFRRTTPEILTTTRSSTCYTLDAARINGVQRFLYSSSACILSGIPTDRDRRGAAEGERRLPRPSPRTPTGGGELFTELLCTYYANKYSMQTRIVRFRNSSGPFGTVRTAAGKRRRRRSAGRSRKSRTAAASRSGATADNTVVFLLHRRLRRGHLPHHAVRLRQAAQPRHRRIGVHQTAGVPSPKWLVNGTSA